MRSGTLRTPATAPLAGTAAIVAAAALWALAAAVARDLFEIGIEPLDLAAARSIIAAIGLSLVARSWRRRSRPQPLLVVVLGLAIALVNATYYIAIDHLAVAVAIVLQYTAPAMLVAWVALRTMTPPSRDVVVALAAALGGVVLVSELATGEVGDLDVVGVTAGLASAALFATYTLLSEKAGDSYGPFGALRRAFTAATAFWLVLQAFRGWPDELFATANAARVLFVGVMGTLAPFSLYLWGIGRVRAQRASIVATSEPVLAALVAWVWLGQELTVMQIAGGLLVIAAIVTLEVRGRAPAVTPEAYTAPPEAS